MRTAGRRWAVAAVAAGLLAPAPAAAGTYDVVSCNAPGAGGVNNAWSGQFTSFNNDPEPQYFDVIDDCRGGEGGLIARSKIGGEGRAGFLRGAGWIFDAPAGTVITRATIWRWGFKYRTNEADPYPEYQGDDGDPWFMGAKDSLDNTPGASALSRETCDNPPGPGQVCGIGVNGGLSAANETTYDLNSTRLIYQVFCRSLPGCDRYYVDNAAGVELYGARVTLTDNSAPSLSAGGPLLADGWHRPGEEVVYDASDNTGIRAARLQSGTLASADARACDFTRRVPCSNVSGGRIALPSLPDGDQPLRIVAEDAAGNATVSDRRVKIDGTAPLARLERARGRTLRVRVEDGGSGVAGGQILVRNSSAEQYRELPTTLKGGLLSARLDRGRVSRTDIRVQVGDTAGNTVTGVPPRITVTSARIARRTRAVRSSRLRLPFGRRAVLRGRLTLSAGQPVANAQVRVVSRVRRRGAGLRELGLVTTDRRGRFSAPVPAGPSRTVGLRFEGRDEVLRGARGVGVRVPAASTIRASRAALSGPGRVRFSGRMRTAGQPIPDRGLIVVLQGREQGRWRTFSDTRTNRKGRWSASYRFRGFSGTYPIRTRIRRQSGFPFELGYSRIVRVRVR